MRGVGRRTRDWLSRVGGRDELERRQASILQAILIVMVVAFVVGTAGNLVREASGGAPASNTGANLLVTGLFVALIALLRRGQFRIVAGLFVGLLVFGFGQGLAATGLAGGAAYLALLMVPIVVAGLLLPRLGLILTAVAVYAVGVLALQSDPALADASIPSPLGNFLFATLFVAAIVDQFGGTVRRALVQAIAHEAELETGRRALAGRTAELQQAVTALEAEIAERTRLQEEREQIQTQLLESQRLESVGLLAGGIAHDFNNLLTAIGGYADLVRSRLPADDPAQEDVAGIRQATDQAAGLTRQLLAFSRRQPLSPTVVDLNGVIARVEPLLRRVLGERISLIARPATEPWPVVVDASQMESIVVNLAINARDAMDGVGTLTIETANVELDNDYARTHTEVAPGSYVMLAVSDTGSGMDEATLGRIFEPFFTTKGLGQGTGLGLATVYGTIRQSGGHIWVYSEVGHGTTFKVYLPKAAPGAVPETPTDSAEPSAEGARPALILVAEDEAFVRDMIVAALTRRGHTVVAVATGEEALAAVRERGPEIGLLITDVVMPGIGGVELLEQARAHRPGLRAMFMSGYTANAIEPRSLPADVLFLEKPFTLTRLDEAIREATGR